MSEKMKRFRKRNAEAGEEVTVVFISSGSKISVALPEKPKLCVGPFNTGEWVAIHDDSSIVVLNPNFEKQYERLTSDGNRWRKKVEGEEWWGIRISIANGLDDAWRSWYASCAEPRCRGHHGDWLLINPATREYIVITPTKLARQYEEIEGEE